MTQRKEEASERNRWQVGIVAKTQREMQRKLDTADGLLKMETMEVMGKKR